MYYEIKYYIDSNYFIPLKLEKPNKLHLYTIKLLNN